MKNSFGSHVAQTAIPAPAIDVAGRGGTQRVARPLILTLTALAAVLVCSTHAAVSGASTVPAAGIGYLCFTLVMFGCASAFCIRAVAIKSPSPD